MQIHLAEDHARLAEPLVEFLRREGHQVAWCADRQRAFETLLAGGFDLALLDWMLPGCDGLTVLQELRRRDRQPELPRSSVLSTGLCL